MAPRLTLPLPPLLLPVPVIVELDHISAMLADAFLNCNLGSVSNKFQGQMLAATEKLCQILQVSAKSKSWHSSKENFQVGSELPTGVTDFAAAWCEQGHQLIAAKQYTDKPPRASTNFRNADAIHWLESISETNSILSTILAVIHPALYLAGQSALGIIRERAEIRGQDQQVLSKWTSSFSGISVIANRITLPHHDTQSRHNWKLPRLQSAAAGLGISLDYGPGTVVGLSGMMLEHQVPKFKGDRYQRQLTVSIKLCNTITWFSVEVANGKTSCIIDTAGSPQVPEYRFRSPETEQCVTKLLGPAAENF
ncbi:hypothetical protein EI94DRAFT_1701155 [Lactarius quietus]|nr:hypothetical protein EI94DRAFT_1701155 [Lactarius quietus]